MYGKTKLFLASTLLALAGALQIDTPVSPVKPYWSLRVADDARPRSSNVNRLLSPSRVDRLALTTLLSFPEARCQQLLCVSSHMTQKSLLADDSSTRTCRR